MLPRPPIQNHLSDEISAHSHASAPAFLVPEALTFDDVSLVPQESDILPHQADPSTSVGRGIRLSIPILSAAMDTVTEVRTAITMAQHGGMGVVHKNLSPADQADMVRRVKKYEAGMVSDPLTLAPDAPVADAFLLMERHGIGGFPIVDEQKHLLGLVTRRDLKMATSRQAPVSSLMTQKLVTGRVGISREESLSLMRAHRVEKLPVIDAQNVLRGLITVKDLEKVQDYPLAARDEQGRLLCAAAVGPGPDLDERAERLVGAGVDVLVVDTAHGHSAGVIQAVQRLRARYPQMCLVAGNIVTAAATHALADAGVDAVKVGIGPGSICTTRMVAGVGVPQLSAVWEVSRAAKARGVVTIADGGIKYSGDIAKALAAGADVVMIGSLFAGTEEAPGELVLLQGRSFKVYRGMGSLGAMERGSRDRYGQGSVVEASKLVPEGIEGRVPYRGPLAAMLHQLLGGVRAAMGYLGAATLSQMHQRARFVRVSSSGLRESHVHDVIITKEAPNYWGDG